MRDFSSPLWTCVMFEAFLRTSAGKSGISPATGARRPDRATIATT
jgi:hypothetical protein